MSNKTYDFLKNVALYFPVFITFIMAIYKIWNIPYATEIGLTLAAINTLIAGIVQIANKNYKNKLKEEEK